MFNHEIHFNGTVVGQASVTIEGLYAQILCSCNLPENRMYVIHLSGEDGDKPLGTCTPSSKCYTLKTKIPKKYILNKNAMLYVAEKYANSPVTEIHLVPGEPIAAITKLHQAILRVNNGKVSLLIADEVMKKTAGSVR